MLTNRSNKSTATDVRAAGIAARIIWRYAAPASRLANSATSRAWRPSPRSEAGARGLEGHLPRPQGLEGDVPKVSIARHNKIKSNPRALHVTVEPATMRWNTPSLRDPEGNTRNLLHRADQELRSKSAIGTNNKTEGQDHSTPDWRDAAAYEGEQKAQTTLGRKGLSWPDHRTKQRSLTVVSRRRSKGIHMKPAADIIALDPHTTW